MMCNTARIYNKFCLLKNPTPFLVVKKQKHENITDSLLFLNTLFVEKHIVSNPNFSTETTLIPP